MSYEIFYDRAFIRVNDFFVPIVNQGSNNTWEYNYQGREIPEKNWDVLNYRKRGQLLFTESEVKEIAKEYENISQESGTCFKSRYRKFEAGEFERWLLCGLKSAFTIEMYVAAGNRLEITDSSGDVDNWKRYPFSTTEEFLKLIESLKGRSSLNVHFVDNRNIRRPKERPACINGSEYYVLRMHSKSGYDLFFCRLTRRGYYSTIRHQDDDVRPFATEKDACKYLRKYSSILQDFEACRIQDLKTAS